MDLFQTRVKAYFKQSGVVWPRQDILRIHLALSSHMEFRWRDIVGKFVKTSISKHLDQIKMMLTTLLPAFQSAATEDSALYAELYLFATGKMLDVDYTIPTIYLKPIDGNQVRCKFILTYMKATSLAEHDARSRIEYACVDL